MADSTGRGSADDLVADALGTDVEPFWDEEGSWQDRLRRPELGPVSWLGELAPSGRLMAELEGLPADLVEDDYDAMEMVAHWKRLEAYCALRVRLAAAALARRRSMAQGLAALPEIVKRQGRGGVTVDTSVAADELSVRLGVSRPTAKRLISSGQALGGVGIVTGEALAAGDIDAGKADLIVEAVSDLRPDAGLEVQERVLERAAHLPPAVVRREVNAACAGVDVAEFEERCRAERSRRRVCRPRPLPHGMAGLYAVLPAVEATQVYRAVDAAARSAKAVGDERTMDQLRADALALMGSAALASGHIGASTDPGDGGQELARDREVDPPDVACAGGETGGGAGAVHVLEDDAGAQGGREHPGPGMGGREHERPSTGARRRQGAPAGSAEGQIDDGPATTATTAGRELLSGVDPPPDPRTREEVCPPPTMRVGVIGARSAHVRVVVPMNVLMGSDTGSVGEVPGAGEPAHLEGYGAIPGTVARALAAGSTWARLVTDPVDGSVRELSAPTYRPPQALADLVRAERPMCIRPGCSVTADSCDLNHSPPWPVGATEFDHLDPACRRDHELLTHAGWNYEVLAQERQIEEIDGGTVGPGRGEVEAVDPDVGVAEVVDAVRGIPGADVERAGPGDTAVRYGRAALRWTTGSGHVYTESPEAGIRMGGPRAVRPRYDKGTGGPSGPGRPTWAEPPY